MSVIWKAVLSPKNLEVEMPRGAEVLHAREQNGEVCIWFLCDPKQPKDKRKFQVYGTGHENVSGKYIGSAQLSGGVFVFHVFEVV